MPAYTTVTLDTTGPQGVAALINGNAIYATARDVTLAISTSDSDTTGYTMKVYGDVDSTYDANVQTTVGASAWITYAASKTVRLATGDGTKNLYVVIRDDVLNQSTAANDAIILDTTTPVVTLGAPDRSKVSKIATVDTVTFTFQVDSAFDQFVVKVVPATGTSYTGGTQIPTTAGSTGVSGSAGGYAANTNRTVTIKGADLETASAGDGAKILKVFAQDAAGNWSA